MEAAVIIPLGKSFHHCAAMCLKVFIVADNRQRSGHINLVDTDIIKLLDYSGLYAVCVEKLQLKLEYSSFSYRHDHRLQL